MNQEYFGIGCIEKLPALIANPKTEKIFLVTGKSSFKLSGAERIFNKIFNDKEIFRFSEFSENPKIEDVVNGIEKFRQTQSDIVIAVGGGSVIDIAKLINILSEQEKEPINYVLGNSNITKKGKTLIAIPTTSGSGSEATHFAVVYKDKEKYSVAHEYILPDISIIDPQLTLNLSPYITATSGIDAFSQAVESYWSVNSNQESQSYSREAIKLIIKNLGPAVKDPAEENRINMSRAANLAGKAINITKTTAPHAVSYSMTSYFGVSHGQAVSITLGEFLKYNYGVTEKDVTDKRGVQYVKRSIEELVKIMDCVDVESAKDKIAKLMTEAGLKTRLSELNITGEDDMKLIEENINYQRLQNNPRALSKSALQEILSNIS